MRLPLTLNVLVGGKLAGKSKSEIMKDILDKMPRAGIVAVQIGYEVVRVTFRDGLSFKDAMKQTGLHLFEMWCKILAADRSQAVELFS